jgi:hypothetical protein
MTKDSTDSSSFPLPTHGDKLIQEFGDSIRTLPSSYIGRSFAGQLWAFQVIARMD